MNKIMRGKIWALCNDDYVRIGKTLCRINTSPLKFFLTNIEGNNSDIITQFGIDTDTFINYFGLSNLNGAFPVFPAKYRELVIWKLLEMEEESND